MLCHATECISLMTKIQCIRCRGNEGLHWILRGDITVPGASDTHVRRKSACPSGITGSRVVLSGAFACDTPLNQSRHRKPQFGLQQTKKSVIPSSPRAVACVTHMRNISKRCKCRILRTVSSSSTKTALRS